MEFIFLFLIIGKTDLQPVGEESRVEPMSKYNVGPTDAPHPPSPARVL